MSSLLEMIRATDERDKSLAERQYARLILEAPENATAAATLRELAGKLGRKLDRIEADFKAAANFRRLVEAVKRCPPRESRDAAQHALDEFYAKRQRVHIELNQEYARLFSAADALENQASASASALVQLRKLAESRADLFGDMALPELQS
jgi:hypothetical protein